MRSWWRLPLRLRVALAFAVSTAVAISALGVFLHLRVAATLEERTRTSVGAQHDALARLPASQQRTAVEDLSGEIFAQLLGADGEVVASSPQLRGPLIEPDRLPAPGAELIFDSEVFLVEEGERTGVVVRVSRDSTGGLVVGTPDEAAAEALEGLRTQLLLGGPLALVLASALGYLVAGRALEPMERMRSTAANISAHRSGDRLPLPEVEDEVHRLGSTLNQMLDRLDAGLRRERQFVAEASHELRTPLAVLRTELDLIPGRSPEEIRDVLSSVSEEVDRLVVLVDHLLALASADDARLELHSTTFGANDLLTQVATRFAVVADGRRVAVTEGPWVELYADRHRMDQVISNLVDNALHHGTGDVTLDAFREQDRIVLRVRDQGGVHLDDALFERFAQGAGSRAGGRGLGLALVRVLVREHGGTVSAQTGDGTTEVRIEPRHTTHSSEHGRRPSADDRRRPDSLDLTTLSDHRKQGSLVVIDSGMGPDVVPLDRVDATSIGRRLAASGTTDIVDAHVVLCARRTGQAVATSDADDLTTSTRH